ncbi:hypothetical protein EJB05_20296 [Eragrostis curvula]|uniref:non-specific serine/threonine protein kinase n=1 Tax=Eragrostis curvula TaxID=38414 RepID=A0A5J9UYD8_9POAL|nr:hypothetical protein EJB05_20296 [Eragrostis curvula]
MQLRGSAPAMTRLRLLLPVLAALVLLLAAVAVADDGAALLEIKKSFRNGDTALHDWSGDGASPGYCSWRGVLCDNVTFAVAALNLSGLNLEGEISPVIGSLKSVLSIDLKSNGLSGQIPDEIGDCSFLKTLDLSSNNLEGDIPFSISKLKHLENLSLKNNQLVGVIPSTLSQLPNLKILDLAQNKLSGEIPNLIYWNEVLQYLGLRSNNLEGSLSPDMCQLTGLCDVKNNSLTGTIPDTIGSCTSFQSERMADLSIFRDLSNNQLTGEIPFNIGFLQVATLSLQGNKFSGPIPSVIGLMQALAVLDLSFNELSGTIPSILGNLTYTEKLYLQGNRLTGSIPPELGNMSTLHYLELNDNQLTGFIPPDLGKLTELFDLNLANNSLGGPIPENISSCVNLISLNLSSNTLSGVIPNEVARMRNLDTLFLGNPGLCGYWLGSSCYSSSHTQRSSISKAAILGIAIGGLVILLIILGVACWPYSPPAVKDVSVSKPDTFASASSIVHPKLVILNMNMALHVYDDIMRMTENLSEKYIIGYGASSTVYKCVLKNSKPVAIKKLYAHYPQSLKEFETELETVGSIKHRNLVSLQGYSLSPNGNLLFYDYMENGSLWDILSKAADNTVMEMVDPDISDTCKDLGEVKKVFQLALLCSKRQPSDRPTMHEVVRVLDSLVSPGPLPKPAQPPASQQSSTAPSYVSEYVSLRGGSSLSCANSSSASDAELFMKFGELGQFCTSIRELFKAEESFFVVLLSHDPGLSTTP